MFVDLFHVHGMLHSHHYRPLRLCSSKDLSPVHVVPPTRFKGGVLDVYIKRTTAFALRDQYCANEIEKKKTEMY